MSTGTRSATSLIEQLQDLHERMPTPYEEDRFYSMREQTRLVNDRQAVSDAIDALKAAKVAYGIARDASIGMRSEKSFVKCPHCGKDANDPQAS